MKKRILSLLVAVVLVMGLVPMTALAAGETVFVKTTADKTEVDQDEVITFTVNVKATQTVTGFTLELDIPEGLTYVAESGGMIGGETAMREALGGADNAEFEEKTGVIVLAHTEGLQNIASGKDIFTFQCTAVKGSGETPYEVGVAVTTVTDTAENDFNSVADNLISNEKASVKVNKIHQTLGSLALAYDKTSIAISGTNLTDTAAATVTAKDDEGEAMDLSKVTGLTFVTEPATVTGVTVGADGKITVDKTVSEGSFTVKAKSGSVESEAVTITVTKEAAKADSVVITGEANALIPAAEGAADNEYTYTAKVLDQYGADFADTATITAGELPTSVTFANGKLSVPYGAATGTVTLTATAASNSAVTGTKTVNVTNITFDYEGKITVKEAPVYGDTWGDIVTIGAVTANAGSPVAGTYSIAEGADTRPVVGDPQTYHIVFNSTDGNYKDIPVTEGAVTVAALKVTVTANNVTVKKGNELSDEEFGYTVSDMVGDDQLTGTATYTFYILDDDGNRTGGTVQGGIDTEVVAEYEIEVDGLSVPSANYTLETVPGILEVRKKNTSGGINVGTGTTPVTPGVTGGTTTMPDGTKVVTTIADDGTVTAEVTLARGAESGKVTIRMDNADSASYPVIVAEDGTETPVKFSATTDEGVAMILNQSGKIKIATHDHDFEDTADHWAEPNVRFVHARNIFNGTSETTFSPDAAMTRSMIATVLYRLDGENKGDVAASFEDVVADTWYTDGVAWAAEKGVVKGLSETVFAPEDNVTREQLATMIYRYAGSPEVEAADMTDFVDGDSISDWAGDAMQWAIKNGIITGKTGGVLDPQGNATRAEVATILQRFVTLQVK